MPIFNCAFQMSVTAYPTTYISWDQSSDRGPISYSLNIKGRTVNYTIHDHYADLGGVTERTMGLKRGREIYQRLAEKFGHPRICRTDLPQDA